MIVVCDMGPLHYLVLIGAEHVLPQRFTRVLAPHAVIAEMNHPNTPEPVRQVAGLDVTDEQPRRRPSRPGCRLEKTHAVKNDY